MGGAAPPSPPPALVEFNAGMLNVTNGRAEADHRRGRIVVDRTGNTRFRIRWLIRPALTTDWTINCGVDEYELVRLPECKDARAYRLKHRSDRSKDKYIWMQEVKESTDEEVVRKFNSALAPGRGRSTGASGSSSSAGSAAGASSSSSSSSSAPLATPATGITRPATADPRELLRSILAQAAGATPNTASLSRNVELDLLRAALAGQLTSGHVAISLEDVFNTQQVMQSLPEAALERLAQHLPPGEQDKSKVAAHLRSPQFKNALARFGSALERSYLPVMAALGLRPRGDDFGVAGFLESIQQSANPTAAAATANNADSGSSSSSGADSSDMSDGKKNSPN